MVEKKARGKILVYKGTYCWLFQWGENIKTDKTVAVLRLRAAIFRTGLVAICIVILSVSFLLLLLTKMWFYWNEIYKLMVILIFIIGAILIFLKGWKIYRSVVGSYDIQFHEHSFMLGRELVNGRYFPLDIIAYQNVRNWKKSLYQHLGSFFVVLVDILLLIVVVNTMQLPPCQKTKSTVLIRWC